MWPQQQQQLGMHFKQHGHSSSSRHLEHFLYRGISEEVADEIAGVQALEGLVEPKLEDVGVLI